MNHKIRLYFANLKENVYTQISIYNIYIYILLYHAYSFFVRSKPKREKEGLPPTKIVRKKDTGTYGSEKISSRQAAGKNGAN